MKCAVCFDTDQPLEMIDVNLPKPKKSEVLVRLVATSICHTDLHLIRGLWSPNLPVIAGHEASGIVEEVGAEVYNVKPGDHVVVVGKRACGECYYCATGAQHCCEYDFSGLTSTFTAKDGATINIGLRVGSFAEVALVHYSQLAIMPEEMPLDCAALLACGVLTGYGAVVNTARAKAGQTVGVVGVGGVGVNSLQAARIIGSSKVVAIDVSADKLAMASAFGATHTINASQGHVIEQVKEITNGRGLDTTIVTASSIDAMVQGIEMTGMMGNVVIVGIGKWDEPIPVTMRQLILEKRITACRMGSGRVSVDVPRLAQLYLDGRLKLDESITARYPFAQINEALESSETGIPLRNVLIF